MALIEVCTDIAVRILVVSPLPPPSGGIGRWTQLLMRWASDRKDIRLKIVDIAPRFKRGFDKRIVTRVLAGFLQGPWDLARILGQLVLFKPDVMHLTTSGGLAGFRDCFAISLARLFKVCVFYHIHFGSLPEKIKAHTLEWKLLRRAMQKADVILAVDEETALAAQNGLKDKKPSFFPNAIDLSTLNELSRSINGVSRPLNSLDKLPKRRVLYLGWILPTKGLRELVDAWNRIAEPDWELTIIGPGPASFRRELSSQAGGNPSIQIHDEVSHDEALRWMNLADIFVLPTYTEGFPNVILEAMAASKPIIATPVGSIPMILDFVSAEPCGVMIPVGDVGALANKLKDLMGDPALRGHFGALSRKKVEDNYDLHVVFSKLLTMWRVSAGSKNRPTIPAA